MKIKIIDILKILLVIYLLTIPGLNIFILILIIAGRKNRKRRKEFEDSKYGEVSGNTYKDIVNDVGLYGEYSTFIKLEKLEGEHRLFTNLYIPRQDSTTTEIDLVMVDETGIYVFESKNYSGWIFGSEKDKNWTQTLQSRQKNRFYNPIWQNKGHIKALRTVINKEINGLYKSYIIFSERCTLKKISVESLDVKVLKRDNLLNVIRQDRMSSQKLLSKEEVLEIENKLRQYCLASKETKLVHIQQIQNSKAQG